MYKFLVMTLLLTLISGCSTLRFPGVYKIPIEQGNIITQEMIDQLKPGMSRSQVEFVLGSPLVKDTFHPDRWDYIYRLKLPSDEVRNKRLTVFFENDKLVSFSGDFKPSSGEDEPDPAPQAAPQQDPIDSEDITEQADSASA